MRASFLTKQSDRFAATLDARLKLLLLIGVSIATIVISSAWSLLLLLAGVTLLALSATTIRTIVVVWFAASLMMLMTAGFSWLLSLAVPKMFDWNILSLSVPYLRIMVVVMVLLAVAFSTPVQTVMGHMNAARLPGALAIPLSITIRFIPTFIDDCKQIRDVARLRPGNGLLSIWRGIMVPLVFRTLASADDLAIAAELKGLSPEKKMMTARNKAFSRRDGGILCGALILMAAAICLQIWFPAQPLMMKG